MPPARARGRAVSRQTAGNRRCEPRSRRETSSFPRRSTPWEASRSPPPGRNRTARRRSDRHSAPSATPSSGSRQLWHRRTILSPLWFRLCRLRIASALSEEDRQKTTQFVLDQFRNDVRQFDSDELSAVINLPQSDAAGLTATLSMTIALLTETAASAAEFVETARDKLFD